MSKVALSLQPDADDSDDWDADFLVTPGQLAASASSCSDAESGFGGDTDHEGASLNRASTINACQVISTSLTGGGDGDSSFESTDGATIKGLLSSFSTLSLTTPSTADPPRTVSPSTPVTLLSGRDIPSSTTRLSSHLSAILSGTTTSTGSVTHLGSTPLGQARDVTEEWDDDIDFSSDAGAGGSIDFIKPLREKASFASHISSEAEDDDLGWNEDSIARQRGLRGDDTPRNAMSRRTSGVASGGVMGNVVPMAPADDDDIESDFELPDSLSSFNLSPSLLQPRSSITSLTSFPASTHSRDTSSNAFVTSPTEFVASSSLQPPLPIPNRQLPSPISSGAESSADDRSGKDDDDDDFFEDIVLPAFFGGRGQMTPPSEGDSPFFTSHGKINLQAVLRHKLQARTEKETATGGGAKALDGLEGFREAEKDKRGDEGLVFDGLPSVGPAVLKERLRTRSGPLPPNLKSRSRTFSSAIPLPTGVSGSGALSSRRPGAPPTPTLGSGGFGKAGGVGMRSAGSSATSATNSPASSPPRSSRPPIASRSSAPVPRFNPSPSRTNSISSVSSTSTASSSGNVSSATQRPPTRSGIPRSTSSTSLGRNAGSQIGLGRPLSAQGPAAREGYSAMAGRGKPPTLAPSTTLRERASMTRSPLPTVPASPARPPPSVSVATVSTPSRPPHPPLRSKKSHSTLATPTRTIERKRSLQNLSSAGLASPLVTNRASAASSPSVSAGMYQMPSPSPNPMRGSRPPVSSSGRNAVGTTAMGPTTPTARPSHFALPTTASSSRVRDRVLSNPSRPGSAFGDPKPRTTSLEGLVIPHTLAKPKRGRTYGDGTELDGFDDLPTNKEKEKAMMVGAGGAAGLPAAVGKKVVKRDGMGSSGAAKPEARRRVSAGVESAKGLLTPASGTRRRKKMPHLIKNLGLTTPNVTHGDMTWNAALQKWEGNESVLREFDKALATSTRPALITQLSSASPLRLGFPSLPPVRTNIRRVGEMIFDPVRMSWFSVNDEEDELDLMMGDMADDEGDGDDTGATSGWERGEEQRSLKTRASFAASDAVTEDGGREAWEAVARHRQEMRGWTTVLDGDDEDPHDRQSLFALRTLIMDNRTSIV